MRKKSLERLGYKVASVDTALPWRIPWSWRQLQRKLERGPVVERINRMVLDSAAQFNPDLVWCEKQEFLRADTLRRLRKRGAKLVHFTPDPYFTLGWKRTSIMDKALSEFDALIYCKAYERKQYEAIGAPLVYMPLGYCDETHRPIPQLDAHWRSTVGFLGGWEPRRELVMQAAIATGLELKIWGGYWDFLVDGKWTPRRHFILRQLAGNEKFRFRIDNEIARAYQGPEVYADAYASALSGAKIGLGLLRTVCPDQHTTRTFEIPACGSMLLADRTPEHQELFEEGEEAEFFCSMAELCDKLAFYAANDIARERISRRGNERCRSGNYAYIYRMQVALEELRRLKLTKCM